MEFELQAKKNIVIEMKSLQLDELAFLAHIHPIKLWKLCKPQWVNFKIS